MSGCVFCTDGCHFCTPELAQEARPLPGWVSGSRLSKAQEGHARSGKHPTGLALGPEGSTCGMCRYSRAAAIKNGNYHCLKLGSQAKSNLVRYKWRGCERYENMQMVAHQEE